LRKENERKDKEARRALQKEAAVAKEKEKKRAPDGNSAERDPKRQQTAPPTAEMGKSNEAVPPQ
jgi:CTD kinase subunit alpha